MKVIRIYDTAGAVRELRDVIHGSVLRAGALHVRLDGPTGLAHVVIAPGEWARLEEWHDVESTVCALCSLPIEAAAGAPVCRCADPGAPGEPQQSWAGIGLDRALGIARVPDPLNLPNEERLRKALTVFCRCDEIRCDELLDAGTDDERAAIARTMTAQESVADLVAGNPRLAEPLMRCVRERGHAGHHGHAEQGWPYGPAQHHPDCPRHPARWSANPCGWLGDDGPARCALRFGHDGAHRAGTEGQPGVPAGITAPNDDPQGWFYTGRDDEPLPSELPLRVPGYAIGAGACGSLAPDWMPVRACELRAGHDGEHQADDESNGDRHHWDGVPSGAGLPRQREG